MIIKRMVKNMAKCELYDRECVNCGECEMCDLDPVKVCDNCGKCIEITQDYAEISIMGVIMEGEESQE